MLTPEEVEGNWSWNGASRCEPAHGARLIRGSSLLGVANSAVCLEDPSLHTFGKCGDNHQNQPSRSGRIQ